MTTPVAARLLSALRTLQGTGDGNSLENVNPIPIGDGTLCWVISENALYGLDKFSLAAIVPPTAIATCFGAGVPGRWLRVTGAVVLAWAHITDDGIGQPVIVSGFGFDSVTRTAVGEYEVEPAPAFAPLLSDAAVGASYRNSIVGVAGVCFFGNVLGPPPPPGSLALVRFQVFPGNILESGDFDVWIIH